MTKTLSSDQQRLVIDNMDIAERLAKRYGCLLDDNSEICITLDDIRQEALAGLCEAAMHYEPTTGASFTTVAYIWCRKYVLSAMHKYSTPLSVSVNGECEVSVVRLDALLSEGCDNDSSRASSIDYQLACSDDIEEAARLAREEHCRRIETALHQLTVKERHAIEQYLAAAADHAEPQEGKALRERAMRRMEMILRA